MDGIELAKRLREGTSFPFLFLSVYGDVERVRRAADYGALG
jgi:DNA-binding NarL/FixJ family response regulator